MKLLRTDATNPDFIRLVRLLDAYLVIVDGDDNAFYAQYNGTGLWTFWKLGNWEIRF